jgi:hypothetical protein
MSNYQVSFVSDVASSSAFIGKPLPNGSVAVYASGTAGNMVPLQQIYSDGETSPIAPSGEIIPPDMLTSFPPRLGENVGSKEMIPPVLTLIPINGFIPQQSSSNIPPNAIMFPTSNVAFYIRSKLRVVEATLAAMMANSAQGIFIPELQGLLQDIASYSISAWSPLPSSPQTISGKKIYNSSIGFSNALIFGDSSVTVTLVVCIGNAKLASVSANTPGSITIIIATGDINLDVIPSSVSGKILLIAGGNINITGTALNLPQNLIIAALGTSSGTIGSLFSANSLIQWFDGVHQSSVITVPSSTAYSANAVAKVTQFDEASTDQAFSSGLFVSDSYVMVPNDGVYVPNIPQMLDGIRLQVANQFNLSSTAVTREILSNGTYDIRTVIYGHLRISKIVMQKSLDSLPNAGVHTEPFGFDRYAVSLLDSSLDPPLRRMAQTYRVSGDGWAFYKSGRYFTLSPVGEIVLSSVALTIPALPYGIVDSSGPISITSPCTISLSDVTPSGSPSTTANQGGMDPYTVEASSGIWMSRFRRLNRYTLPTSGIVVYIKSPYSDFIRYAPRNGKVVVAHYLDGSIVVKNPSRRSGIVVETCMVTPSMTSTPGFTTLYASQNTALDFNVGAPVVVYVDKDILRITIDDNPYYILAGGSIEVSSVRYSYTVNTLATIGTLSFGTTETQFTLTSVPQIPVLVTLVVSFGDMCEKTIQSFEKTSESFEYFTRVPNGLVAYQFRPLKVFGTTNKVDITFRKPNEIDAFRETGFLLGTENESEYRFAERIKTESSYKKEGDVEIYGLIRNTYSTGSTRVSVNIRPGIYNSDDTPTKTIVVDDENSIDLSSFPFTLGVDTYTAVEIPSSSSRLEMTQSQASDLLRSLSLNEESILQSTAQLNSSYQDGKLVLRGISSSGIVTVCDKTGHIYSIVVRSST